MISSDYAQATSDARREQLTRSWVSHRTIRDSIRRARRAV
jgi:hypothetical protein